PTPQATPSRACLALFREGSARPGGSVIIGDAYVTANGRSTHQAAGLTRDGPPATVGSPQQPQPLHAVALLWSNLTAVWTGAEDHWAKPEDANAFDAGRQERSA